MGDIIEQLQWRYAVKKFDGEKALSDDQMRMLKHAFNLTATSYGLQPIKMVVVHNKELKEKLVRYSYFQKQVAQASHVLVLCIETKIDRAYIADYFDRVQKIRGTSDDILQPYKVAMQEDFTKMETAEIKAWATNQAYLALGNLLTICAVEKIDSCPMEGFSAEGYDTLLELENYGLTSVLVLPVGFRAEDDMFSGFKKVRRHMNDSVIDIT
jgi:nitroreductase